MSENFVIVSNDGFASEQENGEIAFQHGFENATGFDKGSVERLVEDLSKHCQVTILKIM